MKSLYCMGLMLLMIGGIGVKADTALPDEYKTCVACHGDSAQGNPNLSTPTLASMETWYIERQLTNFKTDIRGNSPKDLYGQQMKPFAKALNGQQIKLLATALSKLPATKPTTSVEGDLELGKKYYLSNCAACHGNQAQGNQSLDAPGLRNLSAEYMTRQLNNFVNGIRGAHPQDKLGKQMAMMAKILPGEKGIEDVIAFITSL